MSDSNASTIRTSTPRSVQDLADNSPIGAQLSEGSVPDLDLYLAGGDAFVSAGTQVAAGAPPDGEQEMAAKVLLVLRVQGHWRR